MSSVETREILDETLISQAREEFVKLVEEWRPKMGDMEGSEWVPYFRDMESFADKYFVHPCIRERYMEVVGELGSARPSVKIRFTKDTRWMVVMDTFYPAEFEGYQSESDTQIDLYNYTPTEENMDEREFKMLITQIYFNLYLTEEEEKVKLCYQLLSAIAEVAIGKYGPRKVHGWLPPYAYMVFEVKVGVGVWKRKVKALKVKLSDRGGKRRRCSHYYE